MFRERASSGGTLQAFEFTTSQKFEATSSFARYFSQKTIDSQKRRVIKQAVAAKDCHSYLFAYLFVVVRGELLMALDGMTQDGFGSESRY